MQLMFICLYVLVFSVSLAAGQALKTDGITVVCLTANDLSTKLPVTAQIYHVFPAYDLSQVHDSLSANRQQIWLRCSVRSAQNGYLVIGKEKLKLWMVPGDTIRIQLTSADLSPTRWRYSFQGRIRLEQYYYLAKHKRFLVEPEQIGMNAGVRAKNLVEFRRHLDSLTQLEVSFWQQYQQQHPLPTNFARFETDAIRYNDAMLRLYMTWYQIQYQKKTQRIPAGYFSFINRLAIRNPSAQYDYAYINFLREYVGWQLRTTNPNVPNDHYQSTLFRVADKTLGKKLGGYFKLWTISAGAQDNPELARTELRSNSIPPTYQYLVTYLTKRSSQKAAFLKPGDKAPPFYLPDTRDSTNSLKTFKGKVVYLCFWFASCGGCYKEFPYENRLVDQFKAQPVAIVSICTITKPDQWRQTIRKVGLKTTNLLANSAWQKTLEAEYAISVYPHYVLIDAEGKIIENFAPRPSQNAAAKIKQALEAMKSK